MTDEKITRSSEHEEQVAREEREQSGRPEPEVPGATAEVGTTPYEAEVEAERRGTRREDVADEAVLDESQPLDSAYRPRSG